MCRYNGGYEDLARHWLRHHNPVLGDGEGIVNQYPHTSSNHDEDHDHRNDVVHRLDHGYRHQNHPQHHCCWWSPGVRVMAGLCIHQRVWEVFRPSTCRGDRCRAPRNACTFWAWEIFYFSGTFQELTYLSAEVTDYRKPGIAACGDPAPTDPKGWWPRKERLCTIRDLYYSPLST